MGLPLSFISSLPPTLLLWKTSSCGQFHHCGLELQSQLLIFQFFNNNNKKDRVLVFVCAGVFCWWCFSLARDFGWLSVSWNLLCIIRGKNYVAVS